MGPIIQCRGFQASARLRAHVRQDVWRFLKFCPDDAESEVQFEKTNHNQFQAHITVRFSGGQFEVLGRADSPEGASTECFDKLYRKARAWRPDRFETIDILTALSEYALGRYLGQHKDLRWNTSASGPMKPRILIVDDEVESTRLLEACLGKLGCSMTVVNNTSDAVNEILSNSHDLIFMDWNMPVMNGGETILRAEKFNAREAIKQLTASPTPVITYSGLSRDEISFPNCRQFKFVDHWTKTLPLSQLMAKTSGLVTQISREIETARTS
jgi:CheY-like chemotaxis protein/ribosome-associated translation inhibitor RaiA